MKMIENSLFCLMKPSKKIGKEGLTAGKLPPIKECMPLSILKNVQWGISSCFSIKPIQPPLLYSITVPKMHWFHLTKKAFGTLRNQLNNISFRGSWVTFPKTRSVQNRTRPIVSVPPQSKEWAMQDFSSVISCIWVDTKTRVPLETTIVAVNLIRRKHWVILFQQFRPVILQLLKN